MTDDKLEQIYKMQKELVNIIHTRVEKYPITKYDRVGALCTAMIHEVVELQDETNWKWWKGKVPEDDQKITEELMDILHFWMSVAIELEISPADIVKLYHRKYEINKKRWGDSGLT